MRVIQKWIRLSLMLSFISLCSFRSFCSEFREGEAFSIGRINGQDKDIIIPLEIDLGEQEAASRRLSKLFAMDFENVSDYHLSGIIFNCLIRNLEYRQITTHQLWKNKQTFINIIGQNETYLEQDWCHYDALKDIFLDKPIRVKKFATIDTRVIEIHEYIKKQLLKLL